MPRYHGQGADVVSILAPAMGIGARQVPEVATS